MDSTNIASEFNVYLKKYDNGEKDIIIEKTAKENKKTLVNAHFDCDDSMYMFERILKTYTGKLKED